MRLVVDLAGPRWLWAVLLYVLAATTIVSTFMRARLAYWQHRVERERARQTRYEPPSPRDRKIR